MFTLNDMALASGKFKDCVKIMDNIDVEPFMTHISSCNVSLDMKTHGRGKYSEDYVRHIRDLRKGGMIIRDIADLLNMGCPEVSRITMWNSYRNLDPHLMKKYVSSYKDLSPKYGSLRRVVTEEIVYKIAELRKKDTSYQEIGRILGIESSAVRDACQGRIRYLKKFYELGVIGKERPRYVKRFNQYNRNSAAA